jgi:hypothetical protein
MADVAVETGKRGRKAAIKAQKEEQQQEKPKGRKKPDSEGGPTFWQKVAAVAKPDWGPRANIYLYRVEPVIDRRRQGSQTYITKYAEPISEDRILADHGSGRYKLMLNFRKPGAEQGDEVDSLYLDLLNLQFPPKIPPGEWVDDPNNKKWAWAKPSYEKNQGSGNGGSNLVEALDVLNEIQDSTTKRVLAQIPQQSSTADEFVKIAKVLDTVRPPQPTAPAPDNTLQVFMQSELASIRAQVDKSREREINLMEKLIAASTKQPEAANGLGMVKELVGGLKELLPSVKDLFPGLAEGGGGRSRLGPWQELAVAVAPHASSILSPFAQVLAQGLMMRMANPANGQYVPPNPAPAALPAGNAVNAAPATMMPFLQMVAMPMMNYIRPIAPPHNINPAELGKDFASWVYDGFGADPRYEQAILAARSMGPVGIIAAFRSTPLWLDKGPQQNLPSLQEVEPRLMGFFQAFLDWKSDEDRDSDEEPGETDPGVPEVLNFDEKYQEAGV